MTNQLPFSSAITTLFKDYIALNTSLVGGENYPAAITLLKDFLATLSFKIQVVPIPVRIAGRKNRQHLIARRHLNDDLPTLLIYNHIDVVPASYPHAFKLQIRDGRVYGRGTADHKGSTVAVLSALEKVALSQLRFNLIVIATTDEETNQLEQLRYLTRHLNLPKKTIVFDPDTFAGGVSVATLGLSQLEIVIKGKAAHSGMSHLGTNAVEQAATIIEYLKTKEKPRLEKQHSKYVSFPSTGVSHICSRCNVNLIKGGTASNVIPDECTITVDFRFIPESDVAEETTGIVERLQKYAHKSDIFIDIKVVTSCEAYATDHPEAEVLDQVYSKVSGEHGLYGVLGSTHAAHWCKELKLPHFGIGVARGDSNMHGVNESANIQDLVDLEQTLITFLTHP